MYFHSDGLVVAEFYFKMAGYAIAFQLKQLFLSRAARWMDGWLPDRFRADIPSQGDLSFALFVLFIYTVLLQKLVMFLDMKGTLNPRNYHINLATIPAANVVVSSEFNFPSDLRASISIMSLTPNWDAAAAPPPPPSQLLIHTIASLECEQQISAGSMLRNQR